MAQPKYPLLQGVQSDMDSPDFKKELNESIELIRQSLNQSYTDLAGGGLAVSSGAGAPGTTPATIGDIYVDTTNKIEYRAYGTASSADWIAPSGAGMKMGYPGIDGGITIAANHMHATRCVAPFSTTITSLTLVINGSGSGINTVVGIYASNGTSTPQAKLAQSSEYSTALNEGRQVLYTLTSPLAVTSGTFYWLVFHPSAGIDVPISINYAGAVSGQIYRNIAYNSTMPDPFGAITGNSGGHLTMVAY